MANANEDRVEKLLDQLENSGLSTAEIDKIERKIALLQKVQS